MPYIVPTVAELKDRFPEFAAVADGVVQFALDEALTRVDTSWIESNYQIAILLYAAHVLALGGHDAVETEEDAGLSQITIGPLTLRYAKSSSSSSNDPIASTSYGRRFLELLRRNSPGIAVI